MQIGKCLGNKHQLSSCNCKVVFVCKTKRNVIL